MRKVIRIPALIISLVFLLIIGGCSKPDALDAFGQPISLKDIRGKWILLNYWADWCQPCRSEIPVLNHLSQTYSREVAVLAINFDQLPNEKLQQFIKTNDIHYSVLTKDLGAVFGIRNISTLPATFVISPDGHIVKELYGEQTEQELLAIMQLKQGTREIS